jgi:ATP-dependent DNA helicase RecQ
MPRAAITRTAREVFGWGVVRDEQLEAVEVLLGGDDAIVVLPTGAGKSAVYQLAGLMRDGVTVVVSPLIALQDDQIARLAAAPGAPGTGVLNSTVDGQALQELWASLRAGAIRFLFLTPEQLVKDEVSGALREIGVGLLAIDEAHCVASWGHDFRPDYLRLGAARERLGSPPIVALTATGAEPVRGEITQSLGLHDPALIVRGVDRPNIDLEVRRAVTAADKRADVERFVAETPGPGLLYTATRREAEDFADVLSSSGADVGVYHAGMPKRERDATHRAFLEGRLEVVVATNAFGMGIDKPDVRYVAHAAVPESLDAYYQEIGRSGRDGEPARAVLFYRPEDLGIRKYFVSRSVDRGELGRAFDAVTTSAGPATARAVAEAIEVAPRRAAHLLNLLAEGGAVRAGRRGFVAPMPSLSRSAAVDSAVEAAERRERIEQSRLEVMRRYADTRDCRRRTLLRYFGEDLPGSCGYCDTCRAGTADGAAVDGVDTPFPAGAAVEHAEWGRGAVSAVEGDRLTVFFEEQGYKTLALDIVAEKDLLSVVD